jgi:cytochrome c553
MRRGTLSGGIAAIAITIALAVASPTSAQQYSGDWYGPGMMGCGMMGCPGGSSAPFEGSAVGDPEQGRRLAAAKCAVCHGADGNSPDPQYPKLAGQNPAYLYWQLWAFKTGARRSDIMSGIAAALSDADAADAASFYSQQAIRPDSVKDRTLASTGEHVFFAGASSGMGLPCAICHGSAGQRGMMGHGMMGHGMMGHDMMGMMGHGMMANVPKLNGQHARYIIDQLNRFAAGERQGTVMRHIATALSEMDKKAVAEFLSSVR